MSCLTLDDPGNFITPLPSFIPAAFARAARAPPGPPFSPAEAVRLAFARSRLQCVFSIRKKLMISVSHENESHKKMLHGRQLNHYGELDSIFEPHA